MQINKMPILVHVWVIGLFCAFGVLANIGANYKEYCVIGAGPGGLQMAYYLEQTGRDYIVYEKGSGAGTFYKKFPIHRELISINKRNTGKTNKEFNMRHDWNSLLSHDESLRMTKYSKEFFPHADVLVKFMEDYVTRLNLKVQVNTTISNTTKGEDDLFYLNDQHHNTYTCKHVIIATGIAKPNIPKLRAMKYTTGYEDLSLDRDVFEKKNVLIMGRGNSGFEVAKYIMSSTNFIHIMGRSRVKMAWATHYVGDIRAVNDALLDNYQLKSLDGVFEDDVRYLDFKKSALTGRYYVKGDLYDDYAPGGNATNYFDAQGLREGYDIVIRCLGFVFDASVFTKSVKIARSHYKYPLINDFYESENMKGVYFAGTITHSLDYRKSAGGFIHGYRYSAQSLHRYLEWKNHGIKWPNVQLDNVIDLTAYIVKRVNEGSEIYQMFATLCDFIIYNKERTNATYLDAVPCSYAHKLPEATGHDVPGAYVVVALEYGKNFSGADKDPFHEARATTLTIIGHRANFLHPVLYHYDRMITKDEYNSRAEKWILPVPDRLHHIVEDFTTKFAGHRTHILPLRRFIEETTNQELRFFYAGQCLKLSLTSTDLPIACRAAKQQSPSTVVLLNPDLNKEFAKMPSHLLPLQTM